MALPLLKEADPAVHLGDLAFGAQKTLLQEHLSLAAGRAPAPPVQLGRREKAAPVPRRLCIQEGCCATTVAELEAANSEPALVTM